MPVGTCWLYLVEPTGCAWWNLLVVPGGTYWLCLVEPAGCTWWNLLVVPGGTCWLCLVEPSGCTWWNLLVVPGGTCWLYLVEPTGCAWCCQLVVPGGACWLCLVVPAGWAWLFLLVVPGWAYFLVGPGDTFWLRFSLKHSPRIALRSAHLAYDEHFVQSEAEFSLLVQWEAVHDSLDGDRGIAVGHSVIQHGWVDALYSTSQVPSQVQHLRKTFLSHDALALSLSLFFSLMAPHHQGSGFCLNLPAYPVVAEAQTLI